MKLFALAACVLIAACESPDIDGSPVIVPTSGGGICQFSTATTTTPPQLISGSLVSNDCQLSNADTRRADLYRVTLTDGQALAIIMGSTAFTPVVNVYNATGGIMSEGDTTEISATEILNLNTLAAGSYVVAATSRNPANLGAYSLELTVGIQCALTTNAPAIGIGSTVTGSFATTDCLRGTRFADVYRVIVSAPATLRFELNSPTTDVILALFDPDRLEISGTLPSGRNVVFQRTLAPGTYYVIPSSARTGQTGSYTLSVSQQPNN